jgi:hypothetical protein
MTVAGWKYKNHHLNLQPAALHGNQWLRYLLVRNDS